VSLPPPSSWASCGELGTFADLWAWVLVAAVATVKRRVLSRRPIPPAIAHVSDPPPRRVRDGFTTLFRRGPPLRFTCSGGADSLLALTWFAMIGRLAPEER
jgi:hypothetical protein